VGQAFLPAAGLQPGVLMSQRRRLKPAAGCAQHGQNLIGWKEPIGADDGNRSRTARQKPRGEAERSGRRTFDRRNTNWQRGRIRAASWPWTAKPKDHQDVSGRASRHEGTDSGPYLGRSPLWEWRRSQQRP